MPDDYVGDISLAETYAFDNHSFVDALQFLGYYVPSESFSNYPITTTSLASSLNGGLLDPHGNYASATSRSGLYSLMQKPAVAEFLRKRGYLFVELGSWWDPTQALPGADQSLRYAYGASVFGFHFHVSEFAGVFAFKTILEPVLERGVRIGDRRVVDWEGADPAQIFLRQVGDLEKMAAEGGPPRFVFAHLLMPHLPVVFDADGGPIPPGLSDDDAYLRQLQFTNKKLTELATRIQATDRGKKAVVVLASDEGQFPDNDTATGSDRQLRQKSNMFAALYFPDRDYSGLYPTITPVNYFRVIFNKYFGTSLRLQPDIVYAYRRSNLLLLDLVDVTQRVRR
jgi:hypothetical protein